MKPIDRNDLIPGTEILFTPDHNGHLSITKSNADLRLVPEPSTALDDPLNWSQAWKLAVIVNQAVFVFVSIMTPLAIAPLTQIFMHEFDKTIPQVNMLFGVAAITLGYANFVIVPAANVFGRRPTMLVCGLICIAADVWSALVTSYPSFIGARVISGLGAAANESIMPMVVADCMFIHQRGLWMGVYFWAYFIGLFLGPIIAGNCAAQLGWRWFFWICLILQAVCPARIW
jgi:MFS family permease